MSISNLDRKSVQIENQQKQKNVNINYKAKGLKVIMEDPSSQTTITNQSTTIKEFENSSFSLKKPNGFIVDPEFQSYTKSEKVGGDRTVSLINIKIQPEGPTNTDSKLPSQTIQTSSGSFTKEMIGSNFFFPLLKGSKSVSDDSTINKTLKTNKYLSTDKLTNQFKIDSMITSLETESTSDSEIDFDENKVFKDENIEYSDLFNIKQNNKTSDKRMIHNTNKGKEKEALIKENMKQIEGQKRNVNQIVLNDFYNINKGLVYEILSESDSNSSTDQEEETEISKCSELQKITSECSWNFITDSKEETAQLSTSISNLLNELKVEVPSKSSIDDPGDAFSPAYDKLSYATPISNKNFNNLLFQNIQSHNEQKSLKKSSLRIKKQEKSIENINENDSTTITINSNFEKDNGPKFESSIVDKTMQQNATKINESLKNNYKNSKIKLKSISEWTNFLSPGYSKLKSLSTKQNEFHLYLKI